MANPNTIDLRPVRVGASIALSIRTTDEDGTAKSAATTSWMLGLDPDRATSGSATAGSHTFFRAAASGATGKWNSVPVELTQSQVTVETHCTTYTSGAVTGLWNIHPIRLNLASNAVWKFPAYPLMERTSATISGNKGSVTARPSGSNEYTAYEGERRLVYHPDFGTYGDPVVAVHQCLSTW